MRGKQKQAQRTKNNVRPSNSGRSAELLGNTPGKLFTALKNNASYIGTASNQDADDNVPQNFQLCFKKMNKKDPVTRQKGLQEFIELCNASDTESLKAILPFWPRLYCSLATDVDSRVREAAQQAHRAVAVSVKRDIAPYLKQIIGAWFVSAFDSNSSAASIAKTSFQSAFTTSKRTEVIVFAQKDILNYIVHNIIYETPENLSSQSKHFLADEIDARYQRIVSANLLGYAQYLDQLPSDQLLAAKEENKQLILSTTKFWKYARDDSKTIKAAWFSALFTLMNKAPTFLEDYHKKVCTSIFTNFDDDDANVLPLVWETAVLSCDIVPDWWVHVSADKLVFPKLWRVLQEAAFGHATVMYPKLVPLLSKIKLPETLSVESFYSKLFTSQRTGLTNVKVQRNNSEMEIVISTFFECIRYLLKLNAENEEVCLALVENHLVVLVKDALEDSTMYGTSATIFSHLSALLRLLSRTHTTSAVNKEVVEKLWTAVHSHLCDSVTIEKHDSKVLMGKDELEKRLRVQYKMVNALKNPTEQQPKKQTHAKFSNTVRSGGHAPEHIADETSRLDSSYHDRVRKIIDDLIQKYYSMTTCTFDHVHLFVNQLCSILNLCNEKRFYQRLTDIVIAGSDPDDVDKSSQLINDLIRRWLSDNRVLVDAVLNVVFHLLIYLKDDEKVSILHSISEDHMCSMLELCLNLANDSQLQASVQKWLTSSGFKTTLNTFAREVSKVWPPSMEKVNILKTCFRVPKNGESYTNNDTKLEILRIFRDSVSQTPVAQFNKDNLSCIAEILLEVFIPHNYSLLEKNHSVVNQILQFLFLFVSLADKDVDDDDVLNRALFLGIQTLAEIFGCSSDPFMNITKEFGFTVIDILEKNRKVNLKDLDRVINYICKYIDCVPMEAEAKKNAGAKKEEVRRTFDEEVLTEPWATYAHITSLLCETFLKCAVEHCRENIENIIVLACLKSEYYTGALTYWHPVSHDQVTEYDYIFGNDSKIELDANECFASIGKLFNVAYYIVALLDTFVDIPKKEEEKDNKETEWPEPFISRFRLDRLNDSVGYAVYLLAVLKSFRENFTHARYYDLLSDEDLVQLTTTISRVVGRHPRSPIVVLKLAMMNKAIQRGNFWAKALLLLHTEVLVGNPDEAYHEIMKCLNISDHQKNYLILHTTESFATVARIRVELYAPDAKLDEEKLSVLTCYLRSVEESTFSPDQDRVIWYWLDTILIHKRQLELTFNKDLIECEPADIMLAATVCRFLSVVSDGKIPLMTDKRTDFMMIALASWMQSIRKTCVAPAYEDNDNYNMPICLFISAVCDMFKSMTRLAANVSHSDKLSIEWNNVFAGETHTTIAHTWKSLSESESCRNLEQFLVLNTLSELIYTHVNFNLYVAKPDPRKWMVACSAAIRSYCTPVRLAAYFIILKLSEDVVSLDSNVSVVEDMEKKPTLDVLPISSLQEHVNMVLGRHKDDRVLDPDTEPYVYLHSYMLVWMDVMKMCEKASSQVRFRYASWLKDQGYLDIFLHTLLTMMPEKVHKNNSSDGVIKKMRELFSTELHFDIEDRWNEQRLIQLVCRLYYLSLWLLPAFTRAWWKSLEHKESLIVDKFTTKFVSPSLILEEIRTITREKSLENFKMKGYQTTRQIVAAYTVEDTTMEVSMQLAANHPLGIVKVDCTKMGVLSNKWKTWAKQLNMYLSHQNGPIRDGIMSWKSNVDKAFEGVEECYVCFSIVHSSNYQLPKQSCRTCHKKFHPLCLYKWFVTSNKSSCPICRNHF